MRVMELEGARISKGLTELRLIVGTVDSVVLMEETFISDEAALHRLSSLVGTSTSVENSPARFLGVPSGKVIVQGCVKLVISFPILHNKVILLARINASAIA